LEGGTLFISRTTAIFSWIESVFEKCGFKNTIPITAEKNELNNLLIELKPKYIFIHSEFYSCVTPYMIGELINKFPKIKINIVNFCNLPDSIAVEFLFHGANSYLDFNDGINEFKRGLEIIQSGKEYYSQKINQEIDLSNDSPILKRKLTIREKEVLHLLCNGFNVEQITANFNRKDRTVKKHITNLYKKLDVKNRVDLLRKALFLGLVKIKDLCFHGTDIKIPPRMTGAG